MNVIIQIGAVIPAIFAQIVNFWNYLDTIVLMPQYGDGFTLLQFFVALACACWVLFLFFGISGGDE